MKKAYITVPVADLRKEPKQLLPQDFSHHPLRESQLLFGEVVEIEEQKGEWIRIRASEQERYRQEEGWHAYPGWIHESEISTTDSLLPPNCVVCIPWVPIKGLTFPLSYGTFLHRKEKGAILLPNGQIGECDPRFLRPLPFSLSRDTLLQDAYSFLGMPYLWGGRGRFMRGAISSVDCSGLINLLYRGQGVVIPRDAHDQYLKSRKIPPSSLLPGDTIYLAKKEKPERMTHVVLYLGGNRFLEAPESGKNVRILSFQTHLEDILQLEDRPQTSRAYYGTYFEE